MTNYIVTRYIVIFKLYSVKKFPGRFGITKPLSNVPLGYLQGFAAFPVQKRYFSM